MNTYRSAGNPHVAAAKANLWSQATQDVLDQWTPCSPEDAEKKARYQQELDLLDRRRGNLVDGVDDPHRRKQDAKLLKADKNLTKKMHQTVVFHKTESDRKRRMERRGGELPPEHYMKGLPVPPADETPLTPESELGSGSPVHFSPPRLPPPRSRFPFFNIFGRRKDKQSTDFFDPPRPASFDDASTHQPMAIMNEAHYSPEPRPPEPTSPRAEQNDTYPGRHQERRRDEYDERNMSSHEKYPSSSNKRRDEHDERNMSSHEKYPSSSSKRRDRYKDESRDYRKRDKYDDKDRYQSSSRRHEYDKHSRSKDVQPSSSQRRSDRDRPRNDDEYYPSRHHSSRRRNYSEDDVDNADQDRRRHRNKDHYRSRDRDRDRERDRREYEESSRPRRHKSDSHQMSDGHHKSRSATVEERAPSRHSVAREPEEEVPQPEQRAEDGGDVLSVSEQLHGSLNVGDA